VGFVAAIESRRPCIFFADPIGRPPSLQITRHDSGFLSRVDGFDAVTTASGYRADKAARLFSLGRISLYFFTAREHFTAEIF
jgi:hypothetical protein